MAEYAWQAGMIITSAVVLEQILPHTDFDTPIGRMRFAPIAWSVACVLKATGSVLAHSVLQFGGQPNSYFLSGICSFASASAISDDDTTAIPVPVTADPGDPNNGCQVDPDLPGVGLTLGALLDNDEEAGGDSPLLGMGAGVMGPAGGEHKKGKRKSTKPKHQYGKSRKMKNYWNRNTPPRNPPCGYEGKWPVSQEVWDKMRGLYGSK